MRKSTKIAAAVFTVAAAGVAFADEGGRRFSEFLSGLKEAATVVSTTGSGTFTAEISRDGTEVSYELTFTNLEGDVRQAHIHIGHPQNSGGIVLWLCDSETNQSPVASTPPCTQEDPLNTRAGKVTGTLTAADVQTLTGNGIEGATAAEFAEVVNLIQAGRTYVNVHSSKFGGGEIRGQIDNRDGDDHGGSHD